MESIAYLIHGFGIALQPQNLLFATIGCTVGTLIGVLPGVGPSATLAMLIPVTFVMDPTQAIIMLAAIYYGSMYGGTITAVLVNVPGEASSAITCLDGYVMAKKGRAGPALTSAAIGSFVGGSVATLALILLALPLAAIALTFGPTEFFALIFFALSLVSALAGKSLVRALLAATIGLMIAMVGIDPVAGAPRLTFGHLELLDGFSIVPIVMGLFGLGEILLNAEASVGSIIETRVRDLWMSKQDWRDSFWPVIRGSLIGTFTGLIPGLGNVVASFMSYAAEKRLSRHPDKFGTGVIEGVAGPETANNAWACASFIPLFTLGIPGSPTMAIVMGALMLNGLTPGPYLFTDHADFVWAVIASFYIGNVILLVLNLPLIPIWVSLLKVPYFLLYPLILGFCVVGAFSFDRSIFDIGALVGWGILGYVFKKLDIPLAPLILTVILGPMMETALRQSLVLSDGDLMIFFTRPVSAFLMLAGIVAILVTSVQAVRKVRVAEDS